MFLIRTSFALFFSPHTPLFTPMVFYFFSSLWTKFSQSRGIKRKNSWKENKRIFFGRPPPLEKKGNLCRKNGHSTSEEVFMFQYEVDKLSQRLNTLTTLHLLYLNGILTLKPSIYQLPIFPFLSSFLPTILWRWRLEKPPLVRAWEIFLELKINTLAR